MIKSFIVDSTNNNMRLDRYLRNKLGKFPQSLIEKNLRSGKIKVNKKKVKSSFKIKTNDEIIFFNFDFKERIIQNKIKYINLIFCFNFEGTFNFFFINLNFTCSYSFFYKTLGNVT